MIQLTGYLENNLKEGYPQEIFKNYEENFFINLKCPICHLIYNNAFINEYGFTFCFPCIYNWLKYKKICPMSRKVMNPKYLRKELTINKIIGELDIFCIYKNKGCDYKGKADNLISHLKNNCDFFLLDCQNRGCKNLIEKKNMEEHEKDCEFSHFSCEFCKEKISKNSLEKHLSNNCKNKPINCKFCPKTIKGCEKFNHMLLHNNNNKYNNENEISEYKTIKEQNEELKKQNQEIMKEIKKMREEHDKFLIDIKDLKLDLKKIKGNELNLTLNPEN